MSNYLIPESVYEHEPKVRDLPKKVSYLPRRIALSLIRVYQRLVSPALPPNTCRFYPTCSHYGYEAIEKYGLVKGGWLAIKRLARCQPFNPGGYDPVP